MIMTDERLRALEAENAALRRRVADLEAALADRSAPGEGGVPYAAIFDAMPIPIVLYQPDGTAIGINRANEAVVATPRSAIVGIHNIFRDPEAVEKGYVRHFRTAMRGEVSRMPPTAYNTAEALLTGRINDRVFWSETTYFPVYDERGALLIVGEVNRDVTEQVLAEQAERRLTSELAERERRFRALFDNAGVGIGLVDAAGTVLDVNPALVAMLGVPREEQVGRRILTRTHPEDVEPDRTTFAELVAGRRDRYSVEKRYIRGDGTTIYGRLTNSVVRDPEGGIEFVIRMIEDVTAQRNAEAAVRESQALLTALVDQLPAHVYVKDMSGRYILANSAVAAAYGLSPEQMLGCTDAELFEPELAVAFRALDEDVLRLGRPIEREESFTQGAQPRHFATVKFPLFDETGRPFVVCGVSLDMSERKRAEAERLTFERRLRETQKLESLGLMAGGVAHDFNNLLVAILGHTSVALEELPADNPARASLAQIELAARRAAELTRQLLAYAGKSRLSTQSLDLNELVREIGQLLHTSVPRTVRLHYELGAALPPIEADATQIRQVLMNLVINAGEAIGVGTGSVTIGTEPVRVDQAVLGETALPADLAEGQYVALTVRDTGHGMDVATRERIFEPFYTTKFTGRGLGLAAVLGIVRGHRGAISVESEPGRGTTFTVLLPAAAAPAPAPPPIAPPRAPEGRRGTVLVVDDEPDVRMVARLMLERLGFSVLIAENGQEGLASFHTHADQIDLALLDVTMPGMGGEQLASAILAARPACRVVLMSGYSEREPRDGAASVLGFLPKPFTLSDLGAIVREALEG